MWSAKTVMGTGAFPFRQLTWKIGVPDSTPWKSHTDPTVRNYSRSHVFGENLFGFRVGSFFVVVVLLYYRGLQKWKDKNDRRYFPPRSAVPCTLGARCAGSQGPCKVGAVCVQDGTMNRRKTPP